MPHNHEIRFYAPTLTFDRERRGISATARAEVYGWVKRRDDSSWANDHNCYDVQVKAEYTSEVSPKRAEQLIRLDLVRQVESCIRANLANFQIARGKYLDGFEPDEDDEVEAEED